MKLLQILESAANAAGWSIPLDERRRQIKFIRHTAKDKDLWKLHEEGQLTWYESVQEKGRFDDTEVIFSFLGAEGTSGVFVGARKVQRRITQEEAASACPATYPHREEEYHSGAHFYELVHLAGFEDLVGRLVVDWGRNPICWCKALQDLEVTCYLSEGTQRGRKRIFRDTYDFALPFDVLCSIFVDPNSDASWQHNLRSIVGIYAILDDLTGKLYVGSAAGEEGMWERWSTYVHTGGHGGNVELREILQRGGASYASNFHFTILEVLPRGTPQSKVLERETMWKIKLGTRRHGLNRN